MNTESRMIKTFLKERIEVYLSTEVSNRWASKSESERLIAEIELHKFLKWLYEADE